MLKKLSLVKQLLVVLGSIAILTVVVLMPLIDSNLNAIIDEQMYEQIALSQKNAVEYSFFPNDKKEKHSYHIIYNTESRTFTFSNLIGSDNVTQFYLYLFGSSLTQAVDNEMSVIESKGDYGNDTFYYRILKLDQSQYLITLMSSNYSSELITSLRNNIIYIQYGFLFIIAVILFIWVWTLIKPLQKIKLYVDAIKERKPYELSINRKDEIGIVSDALIEMKTEIDKQEKIKEEMIHNISHDLKTPIALIKTYGQSVKDDIYPYGDKNTSMDIILENADRLDHKVKSFLYLNRLDYLDGQEMELTPFNMLELIEHVVSQMEALNDIHIETDLANVSFIGNEEHWRIAIENVIENAMRYAKTLIKITLTDRGLLIYNDGEHLDEEKKEYLFNPYVKGVKGQFGLGLSIVYKTATMYGYSVTAENNEVGVTFIFEKL